MDQDKLQTFLLKYGSEPEKSVKWFIAGLFTFITGLTLIYLALATVLWLQIIGVVLLVLAVLMALKGYVGILANRLAYFRHRSYKNREKYKHLE